MADKTIGELTEAIAIDDTSKILGEQQGSAVYYTGKTLKDYAVAAAEAKALSVWATADKTEIINEVLAQLPVAEGELF